MHRATARERVARQGVLRNRIGTIEVKYLKIIRRIIFIIALIVFIGSGIYLGKYFYDRHVSSQNMDAVKSLLVTEAEDESADLPARTQDDILVRYSQLYEQNTDMAGWITIEGTNIDYPVMYIQGDNETYLHSNFNKEYDAGGVPFIDGNNILDPRDDNLVIYGHNMNDKSMFQNLMNYKEYSFYEEHPVVQFDTIKELGSYDIAAVILAKASAPGDEGFHYDHSYSFDSEEAFQEYWRNIQALSLYDTGITPEYGDQLITLSTCEYSQEDGRLAVIAVKRDATSK